MMDEIPVNEYRDGKIIPRSSWAQIKPTEVHAALTLPLKGVIVHHTGVIDHQCNRSGKIICYCNMMEIESPP